MQAATSGNDTGLTGTVVAASVTVNAVNDPPTLDAIADPATIPSNSGPQMVGLSGIGAGPLETQSLMVTAVSDNPR